MLVSIDMEVCHRMKDIFQQTHTNKELLLIRLLYFIMVHKVLLSLFQRQAI